LREEGNVERWVNYGLEVLRDFESNASGVNPGNNGHGNFSLGSLSAAGASVVEAIHLDEVLIYKFVVIAGSLKLA
jgi:hypothetical protein